MITKDSIESAYCFFHQKWRVYEFSNNEQQKEDIQYAISMYVESMSQELYRVLAHGKTDFLVTAERFSDDMPCAISLLDQMMTTEECSE